MKSPRRLRWKTAVLVIVFTFVSAWTLGSLLIPFPIEQGEFPLSPRWTTKLDGNVVGLSASATGVTVVRTAVSTAGLDTKSGAILWSIAIGSSHDPAPAGVLDEKAFVANADAIWALNAQTGEVVWTMPITTVTDARILTISDCCVLVNRVSRDITAYERATGRVMWTVPAGPGFVTAHADEDVVYVADHGIVALDMTTGAALWTADVGVIGDSDLQNGRLYYRQRSSSAGPRIAAYDVAKQVEVWSRGLNDEDLNEVVSRSEYVLVSGLSTLRALNAETGEVVWSTAFYKGHAVVVLDSMAFIVDDFGQRVVAYELGTGQAIGSLRFGLPRLLAVQNDNLIATPDFLIIGHGRSVFAYAGKQTSD